MKRAHPTRSLTNKQWQSTCLAGSAIFLAVVQASAAGWAADKAVSDFAGATRHALTTIAGRP